MTQEKDASAEEIQQVVQQAVNRMTRSMGSAEVVIPPPLLIEDAGGGPNWDIPRYDGDSIYEEVVRRVVRDAQAEYRLKVE